MKKILAVSVCTLALALGTASLFAQEAETKTPSVPLKIISRFGDEQTKANYAPLFLYLSEEPKQAQLTLKGAKGTPVKLHPQDPQDGYSILGTSRVSLSTEANRSFQVQVELKSGEQLALELTTTDDFKKVLVKRLEGAEAEAILAQPWLSDRERAAREREDQEAYLKAFFQSEPRRDRVIRTAQDMAEYLATLPGPMQGHMTAAHGDTLLLRQQYVWTVRHSAVSAKVLKADLDSFAGSQGFVPGSYGVSITETGYVVIVAKP